MSTPGTDTLGSLLEKQAPQTVGQLIDHLAAEGINKVVKPATPPPTPAKAEVASSPAAPAPPKPTAPVPTPVPAPASELAAPPDERPDAVLPLDTHARDWMPTGGERWRPGLTAEPHLPAAPEKPAQPEKLEPDLERLLDQAAAHQANANAQR